MSDDTELKTINDAIYLRGLFVQRYSGIEFALAELIMRARQHSAYNKRGDLPFRFRGKLARLVDLMETDGPIKSYADELRETLGNFTEFEEQRHFLVHGIMTIPKSAVDRTTLRFIMYDRKKVIRGDSKKSIVHVGVLSLTLEHFETLATALHPISTNFTALVAKICQEVPLPALYE